MTVAFDKIMISCLAWATVCLSFPASAVERVVSLDYCADQYVLALADREQIMALSRDAGEIFSFYADRAQGLPQFGATAEEIIHMKPDLVVRNWQGYEFLPLLKDAGIPVASTLYGSTLDTLYKNIRQIGAALGQGTRAEELIGDYKRRHAALKALPPLSLRAVYITAGGVTAGKGTFIAETMRLAGLTVMVDEFDLTGWKPFPLERLVHTPPDIIIGGFFDQKKKYRLNWSISRHPRVAKMMEDIPTLMVGGRYLSCAGAFTIEAAEYIRAAAVALIREPQQ